jgi:hypothetical protein
MVGNINALGQPGIPHEILPIKTKWFNNGTDEKLLAIDEQGRPLNEDCKSWYRGKLSNKHPTTAAVKNARVQEESKNT